MNKAELVEEIVNQTGLTKRESGEAPKGERGIIGEKDGGYQEEGKATRAKGKRKA